MINMSGPHLRQFPIGLLTLYMLLIHKMLLNRSLKSTDNAFSTYKWFEPIPEKTKQYNISRKDNSLKCMILFQEMYIVVKLRFMYFIRVCSGQI